MGTSSSAQSADIVDLLEVHLAMARELEQVKQESERVQAAMARDLEQLKQENERLRIKNEVLEAHFGLDNDAAFDDPFELPPEAKRSQCSLWLSLSPPATSTATPRSVPESDAGTLRSATPMSQSLDSGHATPMSAQAAAPTPMWFCGRFRTIPHGIVKQARAIFEQTPHTDTPHTDTARPSLPPPVFAKPEVAAC
eukprot:NODE_3960_length_724_cov_164.866966.p1 GENE.NODE_3960_length_724_cov_164.866966~~NODE_3960_length_724_cov_164.866966.p1  ORF type:complete len:196 (+),score=44.80 NODE_3960_length_724_cov_164.866966:3-590(+)